MAKSYDHLDMKPPLAGRATWLDSLNHKAEIFFNDLDHYVDFCIARFLVWRELRRERKRNKRGETKE
ncbi:MAG TPA: hypothetical protein VIG62_11490 [Blastocatellia bacterium]